VYTTKKEDGNTEGSMVDFVAKWVWGSGDEVHQKLKNFKSYKQILRIFGIPNDIGTSHIFT